MDYYEAKQLLNNDFARRDILARIISGQGPDGSDFHRQGRLDTRPLRDFGEINTTGGGSRVNGDTLEAAAASGVKMIEVPAGIILIDDRKIVVTGATSFVGLGAGATEIRTPSVNQPIFELDPGDSIQAGSIRDMTLRCMASSPTDGSCAIHLKSGALPKILDNRISSFDAAMKVTDGYGFFFERNYVVSNKRYGIWNRGVAHPDRGDSGVVNNVFDNASGSVAAICYESGGGMRISANKILHSNYGVLIQPEEYSTTLQAQANAGQAQITVVNPTGLSTNGQLLIGAEAATILSYSGNVVTLTANLAGTHSAGTTVLVGITTSVCPINGGSIEGQALAHIKMKRKGTVGSFSLITINGVQMNGAAAGGDVDAGIIIGAGASGGSISGNTMFGKTDATAIDFETGADDWDVGQNRLQSWLNGVRVQNGATDIQIAKQKCRGVTYDLLHQASPANNYAFVDTRYAKRTGVITSPVTYTDQFRVDPRAGTALRCRLTISAVANTGIGPICRTIDFILTRNTAGTACTVTTLTDNATAITCDVLFDVARLGGALYVGVRRNASDGAANISGESILTVEGVLERISVF